MTIIRVICPLFPPMENTHPNFFVLDFSSCFFLVVTQLFSFLLHGWRLLAAHCWLGLARRDGLAELPGWLGWPGLGWLGLAGWAGVGLDGCDYYASQDVGSMAPWTLAIICLPGIYLVSTQDFWQLTPVKSVPLCSNPFKRDLEAAEQKLLRMFWQRDADSVGQMFELTQPMRTKDKWLQTSANVAAAFSRMLRTRDTWRSHLHTNAGGPLVPIY